MFGNIHDSDLPDGGRMHMFGILCLHGIKIRRFLGKMRVYRVRFM